MHIQVLRWGVGLGGEFGKPWLCEERAEGDPRLVDLKPNGGALSGLTVVIQMKKTRRTPNICTAKSVHQKTFQGGRTVLMFLQI